MKWAADTMFKKWISMDITMGAEWWVIAVTFFVLLVVSLAIFLHEETDI